MVNFSSNVTVEGSPFVVSATQSDEFFSQASDGGDAEPVNESINKWHFIHLK